MAIQLVPASKNFPIQKLAKKNMPSVFCNTDDIVFMDYLPRCVENLNVIFITRHFYADLLDQLNRESRLNTRGILPKRTFLSHDLAPAHTSGVVSSKLRTQDFQLIKHPPYSPDVVPSYYYLFSNLNKNFKVFIFRTLKVPKMLKREGLWSNQTTCILEDQIS